MLELTTLLLGGVLALAFFWWTSTRRPNGSPPGPGFTLPFIGHVHLLRKDPRAQFAEWRRQYGDVFSLYVGGSLMVVLNGYDVIKDAMVKHSDDFNDRPHTFYVDSIRKNEGVSGTSGAHWKEQRKASIEILRKMGMGKNVLAQKIQEEVSHYIKAIASYQGQRVDLKELTNISVSNNICSIVFGRRFEYDDSSFVRYLHGLEETMKIIRESNLKKVLGDLFIAGSETTSTFIMWTLLIFLHYPDVQEKCFQEVSRVIGTQRAPSIRDKPELTYLEATIMEVQRWVNIVPLGALHGLTYDVSFRGYFLSKGSLIVTNLDSIFTDSKIWHEPHLFRPERFILPDGKLNRPEEFIPFGIGRRVCLGEFLARMEMFLYLSTMVQQFRFLPAEDEPLPPLKGTLGLSFVPNPYKLRACLRQ